MSLATPGIYLSKEFLNNEPKTNEPTLDFTIMFTVETLPQHIPSTYPDPTLLGEEN